MMLFLDLEISAKLFSLTALLNGAINPNVFSTLAKKWYDGFDNNSNNQTIVLNNNNYSQDDRTRLLNALEVSQTSLPDTNSQNSHVNTNINTNVNKDVNLDVISLPDTEHSSLHDNITSSSTLSPDFSSIPTFRVFDEHKTDTTPHSPSDTPHI